MQITLTLQAEKNGSLKLIDCKRSDQDAHDSDTKDLIKKLTNSKASDAILKDFIVKTVIDNILRNDSIMHALEIRR